MTRFKSIASIVPSFRSSIAIIHNLKLSTRVANHAAITQLVSILSSILWIALCMKTMKLGVFLVVDFPDVLYAWMAEANFLFHSVLWADAIFLNILPRKSTRLFLESIRLGVLRSSLPLFHGELSGDVHNEMIRKVHTLVTL